MPIEAQGAEEQFIVVAILFRVVVGEGALVPLLKSLLMVFELCDVQQDCWKELACVEGVSVTLYLHCFTSRAGVLDIVILAELLRITLGKTFIPRSLQPRVQDI